MAHPPAFLPIKTFTQTALRPLQVIRHPFPAPQSAGDPYCDFTQLAADQPVGLRHSLSDYQKDEGESGDSGDGWVGEGV